MLECALGEVCRYEVCLTMWKSGSSLQHELGLRPGSPCILRESPCAGSRDWKSSGRNLGYGEMRWRLRDLLAAHQKACAVAAEGRGEP